MVFVFGQVLPPHHADQMSQRSKMFRIAIWRCSLNVFVFFGQVMSPHHFDQMSQRSQVSRIGLWRCSQNVFVFDFVFVFVFVNFFLCVCVRSLCYLCVCVISVCVCAQSGSFWSNPILSRRIDCSSVRWGWDKNTDFIMEDFIQHFVEKSISRANPC